VKDIRATINKYRENKGWTEYQLAQAADLPQSTISSWYGKNMLPSLSSLEKISNAFGITMSQLLAEDDEPVSLTETQKKLLKVWSGLTEDQQNAILTLMENM